MGIRLQGTDVNVSRMTMHMALPVKPEYMALRKKSPEKAVPKLGRPALSELPK